MLSLTFSLTGSLMQTNPKNVVSVSIYLVPSFSLKYWYSGLWNSSEVFIFANPYNLLGFL